MTSDGTPWRPLVHVQDIAHAIACALEAPRSVVHNQIFNVGSTAENYQVKEIAEIVAEVFTGCQLSFGKSDGDNRSYRVCFDKIHSTLPGFHCQHTRGDGSPTNVRTVREDRHGTGDVRFPPVHPAETTPSLDSHRPNRRAFLLDTKNALNGSTRRAFGDNSGRSSSSGNLKT